MVTFGQVHHFSHLQEEGMFLLQEKLQVMVEQIMNHLNCFIPVMQIKSSYYNYIFGRWGGKSVSTSIYIRNAEPDDKTGDTGGNTGGGSVDTKEYNLCWK